MCAMQTEYVCPVGLISMRHQAIYIYALKLMYNDFCNSTTGKDYPIQASTRDEMLVWVSAINDASVSFNITCMLFEMRNVNDYCKQ